VDPSTIVIIGSAVGAAGMTVRRIVVSLERRGDRKLVRYVFDQTKSTDALKGYIELWRPQRSAVSSGRGSESEAGSPSPPQLAKGRESRHWGASSGRWRRKAPGRGRG
jgi:hypothetical protein